MKPIPSSFLTNESGLSLVWNWGVFIRESGVGSMMDVTTESVGAGEPPHDRACQTLFRQAVAH
jgi:hypothetical protein